MLKRREKDREYGGLQFYEYGDFYDENKAEENVLQLIKKKRHLLDNCFEDENFDIQPC